VHSRWKFSDWLGRKRSLVNFWIPYPVFFFFFLVIVKYSGTYQNVLCFSGWRILEVYGSHQMLGEPGGRERRPLDRRGCQINRLKSRTKRPKGHSRRKFQRFGILILGWISTRLRGVFADKDGKAIGDNLPAICASDSGPASLQCKIPTHKKKGSSSASSYLVPSWPLHRVGASLELDIADEMEFLR